MEIDQEKTTPSVTNISESSSIPASSSDAVQDQNPISSIVPPLAPIPAPLPSLSRPRPPVLRPPSVPPQNGERIGSSDSDSDHDDIETTRINKGTGEYEISEESRVIRERQEKAMQDLMMRRRAAALAVPTNDMAVRARLRHLGEPITLFGEREMERRDRLRMIMAKLDADGQLEKLMKALEDEEAAASAYKDEAEDDMVQYPFYTEGSKSLLDARIDIAKYSLVRAALRIQRAQRRRDDPDEDVNAEMDWSLKQAANLSMEFSEIGDDRPLTGCSFSRDGNWLATWYGFVTMIDFYMML